MRSGSLLNHGMGRQTQDLHKHLHLFRLALPGEDRIAEIEFADDAAERPDIDGGSVHDAHDDFRCAIVPTLNIGIELFPLEAARSRIDDLNPSFIFLFQQYILGFQIAMNNLMPIQEIQPLQHLNRHPPNQIQIHTIELVQL